MLIFGCDFAPKTRLVAFKRAGSIKPLTTSENAKTSQKKACIHAVLQTRKMLYFSTSACDGLAAKRLYITPQCNHANSLQMSRRPAVLVVVSLLPFTAYIPRLRYMLCRRKRKR